MGRRPLDRKQGCANGYDPQMHCSRPIPFEGRTHRSTLCESELGSTVLYGKRTLFMSTLRCKLIVDDRNAHKSTSSADLQIKRLRLSVFPARISRMMRAFCTICIPGQRHMLRRGRRCLRARRIEEGGLLREKGTEIGGRKRERMYIDRFYDR
jgi:hypothetical protein